MRVSNERTPYLQELIRLSSEATLIIPNLVFNEELDVNNHFKDFRDALNWFENERHGDKGGDKGTVLLSPNDTK